MSIERDQYTRKQMRVGVSGENVLPPLDEFSVTHEEFDHAKAMESFKKLVDSMYERPVAS